MLRRGVMDDARTDATAAGSHATTMIINSLTLILRTRPAPNDGMLCAASVLDAVSARDAVAGVLPNQLRAGETGMPASVTTMS